MTNNISKISTIFYNENTYPVYQGIYGKYYDINNMKYDIHFPIEWATDHKSYIEDGVDVEGSRSGPENCGNCKSVGEIHGVFAFYCANCTDFVYNGTRGEIGIYDGFTITEDEMHKAFHYLRNVSKDQIGCKKNI